MKSSLPILLLYFKAGIGVSAVPIAVCAVVTFFLPPAASIFRSWATLIFFLMSAVMAFKLQSIETLLFTSGLSPARRLTHMYIGRVMHLLPVAACIAIAHFLATPTLLYNPGKHLLGYLHIPIYLTLLALATALLWVDLQARRFAGMRPWDSLILFVVGQFSISYSLTFLGYYTSMTSSPLAISPQFFLFITTAPVLLLPVFTVSRLISAHSLLSESEIT